MHGPRNLTAKIVASMLLQAVCSQKAIAKHWKRDFWDYFTTENCIFNASEGSLMAVALYTTQLLSEESDKLQEVLSMDFPETAFFLGLHTSSFRRQSAIFKQHKSLPLQGDGSL